MQKELKAIRRRMVLDEPYHLSFCTLKRLETYYIVISDDTDCGIGEITPLPGYGRETSETIQVALKIFIKSLLEGVTIDSLIENNKDIYPFTVSALATARDILDIGSRDIFNPIVPRKVPIAAICRQVDESELCNFVCELIKYGYHVIKIKIGWMDLEEDIERINIISDVMSENIELRIDANEALSLSDTIYLCNKISHLRIALLEQPLPRTQWDDYQILVNEVPFPIMLDESIWNILDIQRAAECGVQLIKLKLCKHVGIKGCIQMINEARDMGLKIVLGNGVQSLIGNCIEAYIHDLLHIDTAGEFNGFTKIKETSRIKEFAISNGQLIDHGISNLIDFSDDEVIASINIS